MRRRPDAHLEFNNPITNRKRHIIRFKLARNLLVILRSHLHRIEITTIGARADAVVGGASSARHAWLWYPLEIFVHIKWFSSVLFAIIMCRSENIEQLWKHCYQSNTKVGSAQTRAYFNQNKATPIQFLKPLSLWQTKTWNKSARKQQPQQTSCVKIVGNKSTCVHDGTQYTSDVLGTDFGPGTESRNFGCNPAGTTPRNPE